MAWLKGLAGKAEDFLNQIDQNAAVAFHSDSNKELNQKDILTEVTWDNQPSKREVSGVPGIIWSGHSKGMSNGSKNGGSSVPAVKSSQSNGAHSPMHVAKRHDDDDLIKFLNSSEPADRMKAQPLSVNGHTAVHGFPESDHDLFCPVTTVTLDEKSNSGHTGSSESSRSSPRMLTDNGPIVQVQQTASTSLCSEIAPNSVDCSNRLSDDLRTENGLLRNELRSLNNEMSRLLHRTKAAEKECSAQQKRLEALQERTELVSKLEADLQTVNQQLAASQELINDLKHENEKMLQGSKDGNESQDEALQALQEKLDSAQALHNQEISVLKEKLASNDNERSSLQGQVIELQHQLSHSQASARELQQQCERARDEAKEARDELEQYRTRAQRILQVKERLISELRGESSTSRSRKLSNSMDDEAVETELAQLRQEREHLREETVQVSARLQAARDELHASEKKLEACREQATEMQQRLHDSLQEERKMRQIADEDAKVHAEELRAVREELTRQRTLLANKVKERDLELTRLRGQLSQRPRTPTDEELESRLHALTQTLVQKQASLETVTTEKNALRLQLEKMEHKHRDMVALLHQAQSGLISVNDTDDAKAQIPSFFVETPFDTGMTRGVKRAYSSLDAMSIRTGVFLRRYPLARIFVLCYVVVLHLWVILVLFTSTPQAQ